FPPLAPRRVGPRTEPGRHPPGRGGGAEPGDRYRRLQAGRVRPERDPGRPDGRAVRPSPLLHRSLDLWLRHRSVRSDLRGGGWEPHHARQSARRHSDYRPTRMAARPERLPNRGQRPDPAGGDSLPARWSGGTTQPPPPADRRRSTPPSPIAGDPRMIQGPILAELRDVS